MSILDVLSDSKLLRSMLRWEPADELRLFLAERDLFFTEAEKRFAEEQPPHGTLWDYKRAFYRHRVTYSEYMYSYEYWKLSEQERDKFISTSEMQCIYRKAGNPEVRRVFKDKGLFLKTFHPFVHRKWAMVAEMSYEDFCRMLEESDCMIKPSDGTHGQGIRKIKCQEVADLRALYEECAANRCIVEECVQACAETAAFHPQSLNTIRVVTISGSGKCAVFGALFRMGAHGSFIDNTHAGGIYASINVQTGVIEIDAIDAQNWHYGAHPDTGKTIRGFEIPHWKEIVSVCEQASQQIPDIRFAGWDLCVLPNGDIELIEGNHAPDFDGGMQAPLKVGVKYRFQETTKRMLGFDPLPLISIFAKTKKQG